MTDVWLWAWQVETLSTAVQWIAQTRFRDFDALLQHMQLTPVPILTVLQPEHWQMW